MMRNLHLAFVTICLLVCSIPAIATTYTLDGGAWSQSSNWTGNNPPPNPLPSGDVIIVEGNSQLNVNNYVISSGARLTINSSASLNFFSLFGAWQFTNNGTFQNLGTLFLSETFTNAGTLDNSGTIFLYGTTPSPAFLTNNGTIKNDGVIFRTFVSTIDHNAGALIQGTGVISYFERTLTSNGSFNPGNSSPGVFTISAGNIILNGPFGVEISGPPSGGAGVAFGQLFVPFGSATVNGTIYADFGSYTPAPGSMYQIISAQSYAGTPTVSVTPNTITATYSNGVLTVVSALPVTWLSFRATLEGDDVQLTWSTGSESNNEGFDIQRSENGRDWQTIAFVPGAGTTSEVQKYEYTDPTPSTLNSQLVYYRLQQRDYDGTTDYSPVRVIQLEEENAIRVFPNPADEAVTVAFAEPLEKRGMLQLFNQNGRLVAEETLAPGTGEHTIRVAYLPAGTYVLRVVAGPQVWMRRVVVE
jgi:hypothetical protein